MLKFHFSFHIIGNSTPNIIGQITQILDFSCKFFTKNLNNTLIKTLNWIKLILPIEKWKKKYFREMKLKKIIYQKNEKKKLYFFFF